MENHNPFTIVADDLLQVIDASRPALQAISDSRSAMPRAAGKWSYNRHVAHVIAHIPDDRQGTRCTIGSNPPVTLEFIARDYVTHLRHPLEQIGCRP